MKLFAAILPISLSLVILSSGCTRHSAESAAETNSASAAEQNPAQENSAQQNSKNGHPALQFEYTKTTELLIAKNDPATGDHWAARIRRDGVPSTENENLWTIEMGPDEIAAGDRKAYGNFILHILDLVRSLQVKEAPVSGTPESFGLVPPLFSFRWKVAEPHQGAAPAGSDTLQVQVFKDYELRLGSPVKGSDGNFEGLYASFGGVPGKIFIVQGAMLKMLELVPNFQSLRLPTLSTISSDDVDELEVKRPSAKAAFYAQRESGQWVNAKHKAIQANVDAFLDQATHLRILHFIDSPTEIKSAESQLAHAATTTVTFKDRHGTPTVMKLYALSGGKKVYATFSARKRANKNSAKESLAIFEVYPEILQGLKQL